MKQPKILILILPVFLMLLIFLACSKPDKFVIETQTMKGVGPFEEGGGITAEIMEKSPYRVTMEKLKGIPDTLFNVSLQIKYFNFQQFIYQAYKHGQFPSDLYFHRHGNVDTTHLTDQYVDLIMSLVLAEDQKGNRVIILDTDNDEDFSDEKPMVYTKSSFTHFNRLSESESEAFITNLPVVPVSLEYYDGEVIKETTMDIKMNPYFKVADHSIGYNNKRPAMYVGTSEHRKANIRIDGQEFDLYLWNSNYGLYNYEFTRLLIKNNNEAPSKTDELYHVGDEFKLGNEFYTFESSTLIGDKVTLTKVDRVDNSKVVVGRTAPDFSLSPLEGKTIKLSSYQGKYVLLEFWGTWCAPCISEIPYIKDIYNFYHRDKFEIIGVSVNDTPEKVKNFINKRDLHWPQILQTMLNDELVKKYNVKGFPANYLIDPDGKIIGKNLRGYKYLQTLSEHLGPPRTFNQNVLSGNTIFSLEKTKAKSVLISADFNKWQPVALYERGGKWLRHFDLNPGIYKYKYIIDGQMMLDPENDNVHESSEGSFSFIKVK